MSPRARGAHTKLSRALLGRTLPERRRTPPPSAISRRRRCSSSVEVAGRAWLDAVRQGEHAGAFDFAGGAAAVEPRRVPCRRSRLLCSVSLTGGVGCQPGPTRQWLGILKLVQKCSFEC